MIAMEFKNAPPRTRVALNSKAHYLSWLENRPTKRVMGTKFSTIDVISKTRCNQINLIKSPKLLQQ